MRYLALVIVAGAWLAGLPTASAGLAPAALAAKPDAERQKWESRIIFYGDEDSGEWSLRIRNQDVDQQRRFRLTEFWTFRRDSGKWERVGTVVREATMNPGGDPTAKDTEGTEILAVLPITPEQVGLFYAVWTVDGFRGSTFCRVGPGLKEDSPILHRQPPAGHIATIVPIDRNHAEAAVIPDPRVVCEPGH